MEGARGGGSRRCRVWLGARRLSEEELEVLRLRQPGLIEQLAAVVTQRACVIELEGGAPLTIRGRQCGKVIKSKNAATLEHLSTG